MVPLVALPQPALAPLQQRLDCNIGLVKILQRALESMWVRSTSHADLATVTHLQEAA
jgi:hypothetical protein